MYRFPEFEKAMNEHFDANDSETRRVLLAVNEDDQSRVLTALTSRLYDNVIQKVDDIDFGNIPLTKGDITKLPTYQQTKDSATTIKAILIEFKEPTAKNIDQVIKGIDNMVERRDVFMKGYMTNMELPIVLYNTMVMDIVKSLSYMIASCIDYIKDPVTGTFDNTVNHLAISKTEHNLLFDNLKKFNDSCDNGSLDKALDFIMKNGSKQFLGGAMVVGGAILALGILLNIIPIMRECIYFYYYNRVRISDYFGLQADLLQMNAYNVEHNKVDLSKDDRDKIVKKQETVIKAFRTVSDKISVDCKASEKLATRDLVKASRKYKTTDIMDDMPDSAASSLF